VTYSYTQISQYLACPRRYRFRYLDGWNEKETRASMLFGRAFEQALAAFFLRQDSAAVFSDEWAKVRELELVYAKGESWDQMLHQGFHLLQRLAQDDRLRIPQPERHLQVKVLRPLGAGNDFIGFIDALGTLDGIPCLLDWKTTSSCYPAEPADIVKLDPQLICYSWLTDMPEVALVVFVRKKLAEIQYLRATITATQRQEFGSLVERTVRQIQQAEFYPHSGIRFPQNQCVSCAFSGLCLDSPKLVEAKISRRTGADLGWLDELDY
jgi:hypothetical protein